MKVVQFAVAALAVIGGVLSSFGAPRYRVEMTTSGYAGTETLANFPVLVKFAKDAPVGFDYSQFQPGQTDLSFEDASGNKLAYEIDTWDEEGTSFVWVKVPTLTAATKIVATWGDPEATSVPAERAKGAVWSAAGYAGVWHLGEAEASDNALDATVNGNDGVPGGADTTEMVSMDGAIGGARALDITGKVNYFSVADDDTLDVGSRFTVGGWFKGTPVGNGRIFCKKNTWDAKNGWETQWNSETTATPRGSANDNNNVNMQTTPSIKDQWGYIVWVYDGTTVTTYSNGEKAGDSPVTLVVDNNQPLKFGGTKSFKGGCDEMRLKPGVTAADWIKAEYDTVTSAAFYESSAVIDAGSFNTFAVEAEIEPAGALKPAAGVTTVLADGETVSFSAPADEFPFGDDYIFYTGYRLYVTVPGEAEKLVGDESDLSGSYTHVADQAARLVWKQTVRKGGTSFETGFASIVSVPGYTADETLRNVAVLFRLAENKPEGFSYADCNGADILFTDAQGHVIPHEIEKWDPEGESLIWVNLPKLAKGTTFRFCYGNKDIVVPQNTPSDVWADAGYAGVWHMNEAEASDDAVDATANGNDGAPTGADTTQMVHMDGVVGGARALDTTGKVNYFSIADADTLDMGTKFTVGGWFKGTPVGNGRIFSKKEDWSKANGWEVQWNTETTATPRGSAADNNGIGMQTTPSIKDQWGYIVWVYDGTTVSTYSNGEKAGDSSVTLVVDNAQPVRLGSSASFKGGYDEVRFLSGTLDAVRIKADYDTVANPDFLFAAKVVATADSDTFLVESGDVERGTVTPAWGKMKNLANGQVVNFSAPSGGQTTADPATNFCFTGYELYVTADGIEALREKKDALSGRYTHAKGQSARLVWFTSDMPKVSVEAGPGGTVEGADYYLLGATATIRAVPSAGMRFVGWTGDLPEGVRATDVAISFAVDKAYRFAAVFAEKSDCAAFFSWKGHAEGEAVTVEAAGNDIGTETFKAASVNARKTGGRLPAFSKYHPAKVIYSDALRNDVVATDPGSIYFTSDAAKICDAGGDVIFDNFGTWISQQESCTLEFFIQAEVYQQYASAWAMKLSGDTQIFFAPDSGASALAFSVEKTTTGTTGRAKSETAATGATCECQESWQHVAVVYDRDNQKMTLYRNYCTGIEKSLVIAETTDNVQFCLGSQHVYDDKNFFNGWISCLRLTKGALAPEQFMRAGMSDSEDETLALWDCRGKAGNTVGALRPRRGDALVFPAVPADVNAGLVYGDSVPGEALFANAADREARKALSKRIGSINFTNAAGGYIRIPNLSSALSSCDDYTIEFFEKNRATSFKTAVSWNDEAVAAGAVPNALQIPGLDACQMRASCGGGEGQLDIKFSSALNDGIWHHVAITYSSASDLYAYYYDGAPIATRKAMGNRRFTAAEFLFGSMIGQKGNVFDGELSCLRVTKRALQPSEFMVAGPKPPSGLQILVR